MPRVLGIDYGTKKIGIALSDENKQLAFPKTIHPNSWNYFSAYLRELIVNEDVNEIVVGLPAQLSGADSELTPEAREFGEKIKNLTSMPVYFENEAFTSSAVQTQGAAKIQPPETMSLRNTEVVIDLTPLIHTAPQIKSG